MNISFQKKRGDAALAVEFFWKLTLESKSRSTISDSIVPELFYDYFFVKSGTLKSVDKTRGIRAALPRQFLNTLHTRPLTFEFSAPLILYGARLSPRFAESFWEDAKANTLLEQTWIPLEINDLGQFAARVKSHLRAHRQKKLPYPMFSSGLSESAWLSNFSPRHKRRLYQTVFGLSRKELLNIQNVQSFLEQTCDFAAHNPRIIQHVNRDVFYDQPHLNRSFKKMTGFSPLEYFESSSILQDNLMSASYNAASGV